MDTVTYPNEDVRRVMSESVVAARFNIAEPDQQTKQLMRRFRQVWTPTLLFLDHHEIELRRQIGYTPPNYLIADIGMAIGMAHVMHAQFDKAYEQFQRVHEQHADFETGAEALFWTGIAALRRDGNAEQLIVQWQKLKKQYPDSMWWKKASFIDQ